MRRPEIFVGPTTADLGTIRAKIKTGSTHRLPRCYDGAVPHRFAQGGAYPQGAHRWCDAVIHIAGVCYGKEPKQAPGLPHRSYTQWEYHIAGRSASLSMSSSAARTSLMTSTKRSRRSCMPSRKSTWKCLSASIRFATTLLMLPSWKGASANSRTRIQLLKAQRRLQLLAVLAGLLMLVVCLGLGAFILWGRLHPPPVPQPPLSGDLMVPSGLSAAASGV